MVQIYVKIVRKLFNHFVIHFKGKTYEKNVVCQNVLTGILLSCCFVGLLQSSRQFIAVSRLGVCKSCVVPLFRQKKATNSFHFTPQQLIRLKLKRVVGVKVLQAEGAVL